MSTSKTDGNPKPPLADATGSEVRCPLCKGPARKVYRSEVTAWGDTPDNSTKGWQCGCDKCDHLFFIPNARGQAQPLGTGLNDGKNV